MTRIKIIKGIELKENASLKSNLIELVSPYYVDPTPIIDYHFKINDTLYLNMSESEEINSFFMVGEHKIPLSEDTHLNTIYLGLSASSSLSPNNNTVISCYKYFLNEARKQEKMLGEKIILWGVTASPIIFMIVHRLFGDTQPKEDGSFTALSKTYAEKILEYSGYNQINPTDHPFVLKSYYKDIRYSDLETKNISERVSSMPITFFDQYHIDEKNGDRVLLICRIPNSRFH